MYKHNIYPYVVSYKSLGKLADQLGLTHVLIGKDIMSYHRRQWSASTGTDADHISECLIRYAKVNVLMPKVILLSLN
ncbi:hypothetical protein MXE72_12935 [Staphylococcus arlettae]|nr:hypothetical protein [Staphylococcus arlettae]MEB5899906.1 hypothetical protein [Staphylococcus arlettae]